MLLTIDIGNTNMVFGIYKGEEMLGSFRLSTNSTATSDELGILAVSYFERFGYRTEDLKACIIGSVVPQVMYSVTSAIIKYFGAEPLVVGGRRGHRPAVRSPLLRNRTAGRGSCHQSGISATPKIRRTLRDSGLRHRHHHRRGGPRRRLHGRHHWPRPPGQPGCAGLPHRHAAPGGAANAPDRTGPEHRGADPGRRCGRLCGQYGDT